MTEAIKVVFSRYCRLTEEQKTAVLNEPAFRQRLEQQARSQNFATSHVVVRGAGSRGSFEDPKIITIDAKPIYVPHGETKRQSYHVNFMPNASILALVFHDVGDQITGRPNPPTADNMHILIVRQPRWNHDDPATVEPPSGQSEADESPALTLLREAKEEIGQEAFDYLGRLAGKPLQASDFVQFQDSIPHPALYEPRRGFAGVIGVTSEQLAEVRGQIVGKTGGLANEGEFTKVGILSLREALDQAPADVFAITLVTFMRKFGIPVPSLPEEQVLPLPYLNNLANN